MRKSVGVAVVGFCALVAISAGVARATIGGGSISTALVATPGVEESATTATFFDNCGNHYEFWKLQLTKGDLVKITWGSPPAVDTFALWTAETTDTDNSSGCLYSSGGWSDWDVGPALVATNGTPTQAVVPEDGSYPLLFLDSTGAENAGPFSFTATVLHAASVALPDVSSIPGKGTLTASVVAPDNSPIDDSALKLRLNGYWSNHKGGPLRAHKLATATPADGTATFSYSLPPSVLGKTIRLQITGGGVNYQAVKTQKKTVKVLVSAIGPVLLTSAQLKAESKRLKQPIYWAGPKNGFHYEFTRTTNGNVYVRYLPHGVHAGDRGAKFLIVATYPFPGAYAAVKKYGSGKAVKGPNGSIYVVRPNDPKSVIVAFPKVPDEIEVYDPSPKVARKIVTSGRVRPVR
jgi:hypothetical protein